MYDFATDQKYYNELISERSYNICNHQLESSLLETPLGSMVAVADSNHLYLLEFLTRVKLPNYLRKLKRSTKSSICCVKNNSIINMLSKEINDYYIGNICEFKTPVMLLGSAFQRNVWKKLIDIPFGTSVSYKQHADSCVAPQSYRAIANAIASNNLAIIVPCHRVINSSGEIGGYAGGIELKKSLLMHEKKYS